MARAKRDPYGSERIASGIRHLLLGKALTSVAGVGTMLLVIRGLEVEQFAVYSVLFGLVDVLLVLTSVGTAQILTRFVPEIFALHMMHALRWLLSITLGLRFGVLVLCLLLAAAFVAPFGGLIGLEHWLVPLQLYLLVVFFRTGNYTLYQVLEATLHQASGQGAFAAVTVSRFLGVLVLYQADALNLLHLIVLEILTDAIGLLLMAAGVSHAVRIGDGAGDRAAELRWLADNRRRMVDFGIKGYFQVMIIMPFSGMVNRLVVGGVFAPAQVALFGFAQTFFDLMQRYLPAQFFAGMVRPVMAARFTKYRRFRELEVIANTSLKINLFLIGLAATCIVAGGDEMLLALTNGKYGGSAVHLLLVMCLLLALESWRHVLDMLSHTVERYGFLVISNGVLGASLLLGITAIAHLGVFALPLANCVGLVIANLSVLGWLDRTGIVYRTDLAGVARVATATFAGIAAGLLMLVAHGGALAWPLRVAVAAAVCLVAARVVLHPSGDERRMVDFFMAKRRAA